MLIFYLFSVFCLLVVLIRFGVILKNRQSSEEKYQALFDLFVAVLLISVSWAVVYAFFGYDTSGDVVGNAPKEELVKKNKNSIIRFKEKDEKKNGN